MKEIKKVAEEEDIDLVIIGAGKFGGNRGQWAISKVVYGKIDENVTEEVLRELSRPVLVSTSPDSDLNNELNRLIEKEEKVRIED